MSRLKSEQSIVEAISPSKRESVNSMDTSILAARLEEETMAKKSL